MENRAGAIESGWTWTGGSTTSKDTWTEIWGDGADAAVKDSAAIVFIILAREIDIRCCNKIVNAFVTLNKVLQIILFLYLQ